MTRLHDAALGYQLKHLLEAHLPPRQSHIRAQRARLEVVFGVALKLRLVRVGSKLPNLLSCPFAPCWPRAPETLASLG